MSEKKSTDDRISSVPPFGLRMLPGLRDRVAAAAKANGRSMNAEIIERLEISLDIDADDQDPEGIKLVEAWTKSARRRGDALRKFARTIRSFEAAIGRQAEVMAYLERPSESDLTDDIKPQDFTDAEQDPVVEPEEAYRHIKSMFKILDQNFDRNRTPKTHKE